MKGKPMKKKVSKRPPAAQRKEIRALAALPDAEINTKDMPEVRNWAGAQRGLFYRPIKQQLTLRIDSDIVAWFKGKMQKGKGYQTSINQALREYVEEHAR
jgi:uncharacterized protein (DUF4415 family)